MVINLLTNSHVSIMAFQSKIFHLFLVFIFSTLLVFSQENDRKGTIRFSCGLSQAYLNFEKGRPVFADGFSEYYPENKISIKGTITQYVADKQEVGIFKNFTGFALGAFYHFNKSQHDFSLGFQPGFAFSKTKNIETATINPTKTISTLNISANYIFYFHKNFHFYTSISENISHYRGLPNGSQNTSWFAITGGLGYQFNIKK